MAAEPLLALNNRCC